MHANRSALNYGRLLLAIAIDLVGLASYLFPGLGELFDIGWAPVSAYIVQKLFKNKYVTSFQFLEELLPGYLDWIPTATLGWIVTYTMWGQRLKRAAEKTTAR